MQSTMKAESSPRRTSAKVDFRPCYYLRDEEGLIWRIPAI